MNTYTMQDWEKDGTFKAQVNQPVEDAVYYQFLNCVPPAYHTYALMQVGEGYDTDRKYGRTLYTTFERNSFGNWIYKGNCLYGRTTDRTKFGWGYTE